MIKKILLNINFIINPMWWFMSEKYDKNWDKKIRLTIWRIRQRYKWDKLSKEDKRNLILNQII